jgi:multidrug efflux pump subunit AcrA (membrane-fusion protein)
MVIERSNVADERPSQGKVPGVMPHRRKPSPTLLGIVVVIAIGAVAAGIGIRSRGQAFARLQEVAAARSVPTVEIATPTARSDAVTLELPGRLEAYFRAPLFARVSGYVTK